MRQHTFSKVTVIIWKTVYISKEIASDMIWAGLQK